MGWSSGSRLFARVAEIIESVVTVEADRKEIYEVLIESFEEHDCDTLHECLGIDDVLDELLKEHYELELDYEDDLDDVGFDDLDD